MEMNDPSPKVQMHSSTAMVNFLSGMKYEEIYEHLNEILEMIN